jgi:hypothetical protein
MPYVDAPRRRARVPDCASARPMTDFTADPAASMLPDFKLLLIN